MPKEEHPFSALASYLPQGSFNMVMHYITQYKVQLTITKSRKTILGDYRHATNHKGHRISVNGNLNSYSFLITILHELAHLFTFERYGNRVASHGKEWKNEFRRVLNKYDIKKDNHFFVEQLPNNALFTTSDKRIFQKGPRIRTRYKCFEPATKKYYLFSAVYEVKIVEA